MCWLASMRTSAAKSATGCALSPRSPHNVRMQEGCQWVYNHYHFTAFSASPTPPSLPTAFAHHTYHVPILHCLEHHTFHLTVLSLFHLCRHSHTGNCPQSTIALVRPFMLLFPASPAVPLIYPASLSLQVSIPCEVCMQTSQREADTHQNNVSQIVISANKLRRLPASLVYLPATASHGESQDTVGAFHDA